MCVSPAKVALFSAYYCSVRFVRPQLSYIHLKDRTLDFKWVIQSRNKVKDAPPPHNRFSRVDMFFKRYIKYFLMVSVRSWPIEVHFFWLHGSGRIVFSQVRIHHVLL